LSGEKKEERIEEQASQYKVCSTYFLIDHHNLPVLAQIAAVIWLSQKH